MPRQHHDTPYRDAAPAYAAPARESNARPARRPAAPPPPPPPRGGRSESDARQTSRPGKLASSGKTASSARPARSSKTAAAAPAAASAPASRRPSRRGRRAGSSAPVAHLTSQPTTRNAYVGTRAWLLEQHGPVCAYCARRWTPGVMTLDHVTPRRGQTAYDRRDNLVLACPGCNAAKRDLAPLAFLLGDRSRAANLLAYGAHLSPMLLDLARSLVSAESVAPAATERARFADLGFDDLDGESPYRD